MANPASHRRCMGLMAVDRSHKPDQRRHSIGGGGGGQRRAMLVTYGDRLARSGLRQHMQ